MNRILIRANGPLVLRGRVRVEDAEGTTLLEDTEVFLCRCGASANKPFCDGRHKQIGFTDPADIHDSKSEPPAGDEPLRVTVRSNAMLLVSGPMHIQSEDGHAATTRNKAALCRCGQSGNKPFCDASHKACGFQA